MCKFFVLLAVLAVVLVNSQMAFAGGGQGNPPAQCPAQFEMIVVSSSIPQFAQPISGYEMGLFDGAGQVMATVLNYDEGVAYAFVDTVGYDVWLLCADLQAQNGAPAAANVNPQQPPPSQPDNGFVQNGVCDFAASDVNFNHPAPVLPPNTFYQPGTGSGQARNILVWMPNGGIPVAAFGSSYTFLGPVTASCLASQLDQTSATQIQMIDGTVIMVLNGTRVETPGGQLIFER